MIENKRNKKHYKAWGLLFSITIIPLGIYLLVRNGLKLYLDHPVWIELISISILLMLGFPLVHVLLKRMNYSTQELDYQKQKNREILKKLEDKTFTLKEMAYYDRLTGLPKANKLHELLMEEIEKASDQKTQNAVLFLYIDQFKITNNVIGHELNERLIKHLSYKLKKEIPEISILSRYSGNEFIVLLNDTTEDEYKDVTHRIVTFFQQPIFYDGEETYATVSIGVSVYPKDDLTSYGLIKKANIALYLAKKRRGNTYECYSSEMSEMTQRKRGLVKGLSGVVEKNQLRLHYQPLIDLETKKITGAEALVRWEHPEYGLVPPNDFITLAEETGEIISIGRWVMLEACRQTKVWQEKTGQPLNIAVNVSVSQLEDPNFLTCVENVLQETGLDPKYLEVEITESMMRDLTRSSAIFNALKDIGVKIIIDDFGTGYSSLSVLGFLPIDFLKIDRSFVKDMLEEKKLDSIIKTIINMAKSLDLKLVAEGIEEKEQLVLLDRYGCDLGQGYYFSRPLPAVEIEENWLV